MPPVPSAVESLFAARAAMRVGLFAPEAELVETLAAGAELSPDTRRDIAAQGAALVRAVRAAGSPSLMENFLTEYGLSTREGVALMCLAEALLRVPDSLTMDDLIADKIVPGEWGRHLGQSSSSLVNASSWALMLTGRVMEEDASDPALARVLRDAIRRLGEPVIRRAMAAAMRELGEQFVLGRSMPEALNRARRLEGEGYTHSYDMLGEAARTEADALRYLAAYADAIVAAGGAARSRDIRANPGVSVKLSALFPRYEWAQRDRVLAVLAPRLLQLARLAAELGIGLNIDAEEADRLELSLEVIEAVLPDPALAGWDGFGVVVQAYGRRALPVIDWLQALAEAHDRRIMLRLVKGAYWDSEIKRAQALGLPGYPVFTRKAHTDISYLACARRLMAARGRIYPQFATHNAHTLAAILAMAGPDRDGFEVQRLHGMGDRLHEILVRREGLRCRIYAPVGEHRDLLAYLVRRLLENGANSSFVHRIVDPAVPAEAVAADPFAVLADGASPNPAIPTPDALFRPSRRNSQGWDPSDRQDFATLDQAREAFRRVQWVAGEDRGLGQEIRNPADPDDLVGWMHPADAAGCQAAHRRALAAFPAWNGLGAEGRATLLERIADAYEAHAPELFALLAREAGKTWPDAIAELREAVDFCRYYAAEARRLAAAEGPRAGRGVFACISPWNFPLAIFTGQIVAALVAGNAVLAKPAEQTPLIAARAVALMHAAGIPQDVLQLLPGDGPGVGAALTALPGLDGVCFTGSTDTAQRIGRALAAHGAPDAAFIAETGGLNAMIVDSSALPEQAVRDILASAFQSAGQRCSALRIVYVQEEVADHLLQMLTGAMDALVLGDPWALRCDIGPLIDAPARAAIAAYIDRAAGEGRLLKRLDAPAEGYFLGPCIIAVDGIESLEGEVFGPVLHLARFRAEALDGVVDRINAAGYGLTLGLHSRIDRRVARVVGRARIGNIYVNRNQIGAVVGSQPFGGEGLSGTGPKAGGPFYLHRFLAARGAVQPPQAAVSPAGPALSGDRMETALHQLGQVQPGWAATPDRLARLNAWLAGLPSDMAREAIQALEQAGRVAMEPRDLPGPTGESNRLLLQPRGTALCLGRLAADGRPLADPATALAQAVQALALGNAALVVGPNPARLAEAAGLPLLWLEGTISPDRLAVLAGFDALALQGAAEGVRLLRQALAGRDGPILPLVFSTRDPERLLVERAVSIDTTAAGGNAALLAAAG